MSDCNGKLQNAVFMVGPFGGSDYYHALFQGKTIQEIRSELVPKVVDSIMAAVRVSNYIYTAINTNIYSNQNCIYIYMN